MKGQTEYILGLCDLCEAEGRLLRHTLLQSLRIVILQIVGAIFGVAAFIFWLVALYIILTRFLQPALVLLLLGLVCAVLGGFLLWLAFRKKSLSQ